MNLGHAELIQAEQGIMMLLRHTGRPNETDRAQQVEFEAEQGIDLYLQAADDKIVPMHQQFEPFYSLDGLSLAVAPGDFIQVNGPFNKQMVDQALSWLETSTAGSGLSRCAGGDGARHAVKLSPKRVVYVSCNLLTLGTR